MTISHIELTDWIGYWDRAGFKMSLINSLEEMTFYRQFATQMNVGLMHDVTDQEMFHALLAWRETPEFARLEQYRQALA